MEALQSNYASLASRDEAFAMTDLETVAAADSVGALSDRLRSGEGDENESLADYLGALGEVVAWYSASGSQSGASWSTLAELMEAALEYE